jgi:hypothetical protein
MAVTLLDAGRVHAVFGTTGGVLALVQFVPYIRTILCRTTQPQRATWAIWTALSALIVAPQLAAGPGPSMWMPVAQAVGNATVLLVALRYGTGGCTRTDITAVVMACAGVAFWRGTHNPTAALLIFIAVDALAASLTIVKAYRDPHSEPLSTWVLSDVSGAFSVLAVGRPSLLLLAYPVYVSVANTVLIVCLIAGRRRRRLAAPAIPEIHQFAQMACDNVGGTRQ